MIGPNQMPYVKVERFSGYVFDYSFPFMVGPPHSVLPVPQE